MAIEFQCPYCTAAIRVPDAAAGKKGTCPKCGTKLMVPEVNIPPQPDSGIDEERTPPPRPVPPPGAPSELPMGGLPLGGPVVPPQDGAANDANAGGESTQPPEASGTAGDQFPPPLNAEMQPSIASTLRRRQRARQAGWLVPLLFGAVLLGVGLWFYWTTRPRLEGELPAVAVDQPRLPPKRIRTDLADVSEETARFVQEGLADAPERLRSGLMEIEFRGVPRRGVEVALAQGADTQFFRIDVHADRHLSDYVRRHIEDLDRTQQQELRRYATRFYTEWEQAERADQPLEDLLGFRDGLGLNALTGGLGHHLVAVYQGRAYRCVYEDDRGRVYFLLPKTARRFQLRGRELPDGRTPFPGQYTVNVLQGT